jgi:hypothetical protein
MAPLPSTHRGQQTVDMRRFRHPCGAPSCALGHLASMPRTPFSLEVDCFGNGLLFDKDGESLNYYDQPVRDYFAIDIHDACRLFSRGGCNHATTPLQVAKYLEQFVAKRKDRESELADSRSKS